MKLRLIRLVILVIVAVAAYIMQLGKGGDSTSTPGNGSPQVGSGESAEVVQSPDGPPTHAYAEGEARIVEAFRRGQSGFVTEIEAEVTRLLADDRDGDRHQKFIIELPGGHTLLVAHNIDLAERVPAKVGDVLRIRGEYEYNDRGGVLHWTHKAGSRNHPDGWIEFKGNRYW
ncbi:MAG: DUF3465 domain-containing protein [Candidatus Eisenbacteria bacterium]